MAKMSACGFLVPSCSSAEFHTVHFGAPEITTSPSLPDVNDSSLHEIIGTVLASWCPSFSHASRNLFAVGQKFRSPVLLALKVLKAQFLALQRRVDTLEVENDTLKLANAALQSKVACLSGDLSRLRTDYNTLLCDRKKLTLAAEQDRQKIRVLTSDIDNAQQFIMAMVDIKLHENFLQVAANETTINSEDAEKSLAKAIAQEADKEGSLWSRILSSVFDFHSVNNYSAAVNLALQAKDPSLGDGLTRGVRKAANASLPPPELHGVYGVTSKDRKGPCDPFSLDARSPSAKPSEARARPPQLSIPPQSTTRLSPASNTNSNPTKISGLGIRYNRRISPPAHFATNLSQATKPSHTRHPKNEDAKLKPTRKETAFKKEIQSSETPKQTRHSKNSDKRKGIIITGDIAIASISQKDGGAKENTTLFTALSSLERICTLLSSSDLGSLEETSDDDESQSRASDDSGGSLDMDKGDSSGKCEGTYTDGSQVSKVEGALSSPILFDTDATAEKDQDFTSCLVSDCPELSPSLSTSPPSTPLDLAWSFYSERGQSADTSPTSTVFSDTTSVENQDPTVYEVSASRSSLNLSKFAVVSGIAKRLSRVITKTEDKNAKECVLDGSVSPVRLKDAHSHPGSPASTITRLKNTLPKTIASPGRQKLSTKPSASLKKTSTPDKAFTALEAPANPPRAKGVADLKPKVEAEQTPKTPQESKISVGRNFLRRLSNIPGSVSRTRFGPTTSESSQSPGVGPNRARNFLAPTKSRSQAAAASGATHSNLAVAPARTKPRSNTVNDYSPVKPSPLSQNVITASGRPDSSSSWKRQSVQVVISTDTIVAATTQGTRTSDPDRTMPATATSPRLVERGPSTTRQSVKNGQCRPTTTTPTAAFMKPVNKSATKVTKRMTNSIKPLIPTWTAGSSPSSHMFRNSLSMIVR